MFELKSHSVNETIRFGEYIGNYAEPSCLICLYGDLGSGKTILSKGIVKGAGIDDMVTSPTFALMNQYHGRLPIYHFDIYRLNRPDELYDLDYEEYLYGDGIAIVEWPERMEELIPDQYLKITIQKSGGDDRLITVESIGDNHKQLEEELSKYEGIGS